MLRVSTFRQVVSSLVLLSCWSLVVGWALLCVCLIGSEKNKRETQESSDLTVNLTSCG